MKKLAVLTLAVSVCFLIGSCTTAETTAVVQKTVFDCSASKECLMPSAYVVDGDNNCYTVDLESRCLECVSLTDGGYQRYPLPDTLGDSGRLFAQIVDGDVYFVIADNLTRLVFLHRFDTDTREITKLNISITPTFAIGNGKVYTVDYTNEILLSKDLETLAVAKVTPEGKKDGCLESPICVNQEKLYFWKNKYGVAVLSCIDLATGEEHETKVKEEDLHLIKLAQVYDQYVAYYYAKGLSNNIITYYGTRLCSLSTGERIDLEDPLAKPCVFFGDALYYWKDAGDDVLAAYDLNTGVTTRTDAVSTSSNWTKAFLQRRPRWP